MQPPILSQSLIEGFLRVAKANLRHDGYLEPVCFIQLANGQMDVIALHSLGPGDTLAERQQAFRRLRQQLHARGSTVQAAVCLMEAWYLDAQTAMAGPSIAPSQHHARKQAIVIVGRNANNTRTTVVMQPFHQDAAHRYVWEKQPIAYFNQPREGDYHFAGLLDYLFEEPDLN